VGVYFLILFFGSLGPAWKHKDPGMLLGIPLAIACMHISWGSGLIFSAVRK
jgi:hypothetical protein